MNTNRITITNVDQSVTTTETTTPVSGFTVIKAPKGPRTPIRIPAGSTAKIQDILGTASKDFPEIYEVTSFNREYDLYVSAPYTSAKIPVAYVTGEGVFPAADLIDYDPNIENLSDGLNEYDIEGITQISDSAYVLKDTRYPKSNGIADATDSPSSYPTYTTGTLLINTGLKKSQLELPLTVRIANLPLPIAGSRTYIDVNIKADGNIYQTPNQDTEPTEVTEKLIGKLQNGEDADYATSGEDDILSLAITGYEPEEPGSESTGDVITPAYITNQLALEENRASLSTSYKVEITNDDVFGVIYPKYPSERTIHISFSGFNANKGYSASNPTQRNILKMTVYEDEAFHNSARAVDITGSLLSTAKDAYGSSIGFNSSNVSYSEQNLISVYALKPFTQKSELINTTLTSYPPITLSGGVREYGDDDVELHNIGWEMASDDEYSNVDVFFDSSRNTATTVDESKNLFYSLGTTHKLAGYIFNLTVEPGAIEGTDILTFAHDQAPNYWNICNEAIITLDNNDRIISTMTGVRAAMQCRIIENRWGGLAPMFTNTGTPSMGGQLNISPERLRFKYTGDQQDLLVERNYNPIIKDHTYGIMITGQRTCRSGEDSDWSYIGHVSSFLNLEKEIRNNVMIPQLGKANNPYYRELRRTQCEQYLAKRTSGNTRIWAYASASTGTEDGLNDLATRRARKFVIKITCQVDNFSEKIELLLVNLPQGDVSADGTVSTSAS